MQVESVTNPTESFDHWMPETYNTCSNKSRVDQLKKNISQVFVISHHEYCVIDRWRQVYHMVGILKNMLYGARV